MKAELGSLRAVFDLLNLGVVVESAHISAGVVGGYDGFV